MLEELVDDPCLEVRPSPGVSPNYSTIKAWAHVVRARRTVWRSVNQIMGGLLGDCKNMT